MQIQQCLFPLIYLDHLQSQQLSPPDRTGRKPPPVTRWTHKEKGYALTARRRVWQSEHGAAGPAWGCRPVLPWRFLPELWIPGGSLKPSFRKSGYKPLSARFFRRRADGTDAYQLNEAKAFSFVDKNLSRLPVFGKQPLKVFIRYIGGQIPNKQPAPLRVSLLPGPPQQ